MSARGVRFYLLIALCGAAGAFGLWRASTVERVSAHPAVNWNKQAAAQYLDSREVWWQAWPRAQKDHGTLCISCHTVVPYALARPVLRRDLGEAAMSAPEKTMTESLEKRVNGWSEMIPFYSEASGPGKTVESHATEAVLNAVILTTNDVPEGHLRPVTRTALASAWALQEDTGELAGGWKWQDFKLGPWEASESNYQGAAMLMKVVEDAPDQYAASPEAHDHVVRLQAYLREHYAAQPLMNKLYVARMKGLLTKEERKTLVDSVRALQETDGGWRLVSIDKRERIDRSPEPTVSDGYATALVVLTMEESGMSRRDAMLQRGVGWLETHQEKDGHWPALSMNKFRDADNVAVLFMNDAATGYAVMALEKAQ